MSDEAKVVKDYILKSPENFLIASAIAKEMPDIVFDQRVKIWEAVAGKCHEEFSGYIVKTNLAKKQWSSVRIYKSEWEAAGIFIQLTFEAETNTLQKWFYGISKKNENVPYIGKLQDVDKNEAKLYFEIQQAAFSGSQKSNERWLGWILYARDLRDLDEHLLAQSCEKNRFDTIVNSYFEPMKYLKETIEPIIEIELQRLK